VKNRAFVVIAEQPGVIGREFPRLVITARNEKEARDILKEQGPQHSIFDKGYGIYYVEKITGGQAGCRLAELPLLSARQVSISA
jgi:hypothetical protein